MISQGLSSRYELWRPPSMMRRSFRLQLYIPDLLETIIWAVFPGFFVSPPISTPDCLHLPPAQGPGRCMASVTLHCGVSSSSSNLQLTQLPPMDSRSSLGVSDDANSWRVNFCGEHYDQWDIAAVKTKQINGFPFLFTQSWNVLIRSDSLPPFQGILHEPAINWMLLGNGRQLSHSSSCVCFSFVPASLPLPTPETSFGVEVSRNY